MNNINETRNQHEESVTPNVIEYVNEISTELTFYAKVKDTDKFVEFLNSQNWFEPFLMTEPIYIDIDDDEVEVSMSFGADFCFEELSMLKVFIKIFSGHLIYGESSELILDYMGVPEHLDDYYGSQTIDIP